MYPFRAILVGGTEAELTSLRREVTNLGVTVEHEFPDIDQAIGKRSLLADCKCFFLVKVNSSANMDQISRLNQIFLGKPIVAVLNQDSDVSAVLHTQRAGAAQVLQLPLRGEELHAILDTVARQFGCPATSCKVIAVLGADEGCGSTTLAINLSDNFANVQNQRCILVELSTRLGRLGFYLDLDPAATVTDLLAGKNAIEINAVDQTLLRVTDRLQVIAGPHRALDRRSIVPGRVPSLVGSLRQIAAIVVLDLPYTLDDQYFEALAVADQIVLMARPSLPSIQALKLVSEAVTQAAIGAPQHLVINCYGPREEEFTEPQLRAALAAERIWTIAKDPDAFEAAVKACVPLHQESPRSRACPTIAALARHIAGLDKIATVARPTLLPAWVTDLFRRTQPRRDPSMAAR